LKKKENRGQSVPVHNFDGSSTISGADGSSQRSSSAQQFVVQDESSYKNKFYSVNSENSGRTNVNGDGHVNFNLTNENISENISSEYNFSNENITSKISMIESNSTFLSLNSTTESDLARSDKPVETKDSIFSSENVGTERPNVVDVSSAEKENVLNLESNNEATLSSNVNNESVTYENSSGKLFSTKYESVNNKSTQSNFNGNISTMKNENNSPVKVDEESSFEVNQMENENNIRENENTIELTLRDDIVYA